MGEPRDFVSQLFAATENCASPYQQGRGLIVPCRVCAVKVERIPLNLSFVIAGKSLLEPAPNVLLLIPVVSDPHVGKKGASLRKSFRGITRIHLIPDGVDPDV